MQKKTHVVGVFLETSIKTTLRIKDGHINGRSLVVLRYHR